MRGRDMSCLSDLTLALVFISFIYIRNLCIHTHAPSSTTAHPNQPVHTSAHVAVLEEPWQACTN